jgi:dTDP-4-amino-4,6-dideoxygalactose transaminase
MIPYGKHYIDEEDIQAVIEVLRSGSIAQGPSMQLQFLVVPQPFTSQHWLLD